MFSRFADLLASVAEAEIDADFTLGGRLILSRSGALSVSYAPFDHIQHSARLVIVGITPGEQQARNALTEARRHLSAGASHESALHAAKVFASFSGPMRANLVSMLDYVGLARKLGLHSMAQVWDKNNGLVHFTSALRYPVSFNGRNYTGTPAMTRTPILTELLQTCLAEEAAALPNALWVPLGPAATEGLLSLVGAGLLTADKVLAGLPHPSGANAERIAYFLCRKERNALSSKTNPHIIDAVRARIRHQVETLL
jgi:hypothetical protein